MASYRLAKSNYGHLAAAIIPRRGNDANNIG